MRKILLSLLSMSLLPIWGSAGGFQLSLNGIRQSGMAHTGTGLAWDASSIYFNPGALAFVPGRNIQFGASAILPASSYLAETPSIYIADMQRRVLTPVQVYASWRPLSENSKLRRFNFGLGAYNPFGHASKWDDDWKGRFISQENNFSSYYLQPTISFQITPNIGVGAGFIYGFGNMFMRKSLPVNGVNSANGSAELTATGDGMGYSLGLYLKTSEEVSLGISYRSPVTLDIHNGEARFEVPTSLDMSYPDTRFASEIKLPHVINIGLGYKAEDRFTLAIDLNFTGWSVYDSLVLNYAENTRQLPDTQSARLYKNTMDLRIGGEYALNEWLNLRGGMYYDTSPVEDGYVSPELPDANRIGLTTGLGANFNQQLSLDLTYAYEFTGERSTVLTDAQFGGTYKSTATTLGVGVRYMF